MKKDYISIEECTLFDFNSLKHIQIKDIHFGNNYNFTDFNMPEKVFL
jgi:hypothetical protein